MVLDGVRVYINGYLSDTTDIEMKRIVTQAGGKIMSVHFIEALYVYFFNEQRYLGTLLPEPHTLSRRMSHSTHRQHTSS